MDFLALRDQNRRNSSSSSETSGTGSMSGATLVGSRSKPRSPVRSRAPTSDVVLKVDGAPRVRRECSPAIAIGCHAGLPILRY